ncbi:AAA family ATPase [Micromonospora terminaliae]|uniref:Nuclease SbcCD subunit C n=1 Tax=Micromonospora terminaliae TaxID=1914461 RepID=A0AAJ3DJC7_9ACTN|nr:AAA family ATPase [Micromonospora terminaliae]NES28158.1 AAA family ATPase [Micromonospora terminaliae]QGL47100.1 AAA family ATPase [Micromonospora terminaliae]
MNHTEPLVELIFDRLAADRVPDDTAEVVLAALSGEADLAAALAGAPTALEPQRTATDELRERIWLSSVTVAGFRGVGPERTLTIEPGPGLTVVVGRNGSGKSSFAEAVELALTGDSARWADRNSVWRTGWRNLHAGDPCRIAVELRVDGVATPTRVVRSWSSEAELGDAQVMVTSARGSHQDLAELGLARPLELYRPFLTAAELGRLTAGTQSQLFDAISAILGLEAITDADRRLMAAARPLDTTIKEVRGQRAALAARLAGIDGDRAWGAAGLLRTRGAADLAMLTAILDEPEDPTDDEAVLLCRRLAAMQLPDTDEVTRLAGQLREAAAEARRHDGGRSRASLRSAELLRLAVEHHDDQGDGPCPVCATGRLDDSWRISAAESLAELRDRTLAAQAASARLTALLQRAHYLIDDLDVPTGDGDGVPVGDLHTAVTALRLAPGGPEELAHHLTARYPAVLAAAQTAQAYAKDLLRQRDTGWQAVAAELRAWIASAATLPEQERALARVKAARAWLKATGAQLRNQRVAPFAEHSQRIWAQLRQESNVELGAMTLAGMNTRRRVVIPVSVDGTDNGTALGVMSQGEMHALGLATFLPRGCAPESPFRFIVVDDPVQSMDPAKVDGLARVLAELAEQRQVVVFTHDTRLPDALARLDLGRSRIVEVTRAERSVVTLRPGSDPVTRYLDDAYALAHTEEIASEVRGPVVAELCRSAIEAACHRIVWRRRVARGVPHDDIEKAVVAASRRLTTTVALALFDDADRGGDVLGYLSRRHGSRAVGAYKACKEGVHGAYLFDLPVLVSDARHLAEALRAHAAAVPAPRNGAEVRS